MLLLKYHCLSLRNQWRSFSIFPSSLNIHREGEPDPDARRPPTDVREEYYAIVLLKEEDILLMKNYLQ